MNDTVESKPIMGEHNKFGAVMIAALLFGIGWHIRGSGTSDVTVAILLLLLFLSVIFGPRKKFNPYVFGMITIIFRALRAGWGTFVGQAGIPWLYNGRYLSYTEGFDVIVPWWQGYFWLFIVGLAWSSLAALLIGGYIFTKKKRLRPYDFWMSIILYIAGWALGLLIARAIIPAISPDAYQVYLNRISVRNYKSMRDNFAMAFGIIPVLIYLGIVGKDWKFVGNTLIIMLFFGIGLSVADIWQVLGRNNLDWGLPFWSMWEYFSGFVVAIFVMIFYYRKTKKLPETAEMEFPYHPRDTVWGKIWLWVVAHFGLFLFGIQEIFIGGYGGVMKFLGIDSNVGTVIGVIVIIVLDIPLYILYQKGLIFKKFKGKSFQEKSIIWLISLLPFYMLCYLLPNVLSGALTFQIGALVSYLDILSFIIVESYLIVVYIHYKKR
ncbi:MAG: hypothetical protein ACTSRD_00785 [Promethearchaeota archaeon]